MGERDGGREKERKPTVKGIYKGGFQNVFGFVSTPTLTLDYSRVALCCTERMTPKNPISSYHFQIIVIVY